ncbi:MAG: DUF1285 domain-containing protein [Halioglobus sp.]
MKEKLDSIEQQVSGGRDTAGPPLHLWDPPLSGDIDIRIAADGAWFHEGTKIERDALVRLFASILRREDDGSYYLVTPVEKWRIQVELHPLIVTDVNEVANGEEAALNAILNTGKLVEIDAEHGLFLEAAVGGVAVLGLDHGLSALFSRPAWYRLVEMAEEVEGRTQVSSRGVSFDLTAPDTP